MAKPESVVLTKNEKDLLIKALVFVKAELEGVQKREIAAGVSTNGTNSKLQEVSDLESKLL